MAFAPLGHPLRTPYSLLCKEFELRLTGSGMCRSHFARTLLIVMIYSFFEPEAARADRLFSADNDVRAFAEAQRSGQCPVECAFGDLSASALPAKTEEFGGEYLFYLLRSRGFACSSAGCASAIVAIGASDIRYLTEKYALDPDTLDWERLASPQFIGAAPVLISTPADCSDGFIAIDVSEEKCGFQLAPDGTLRYRGDDLASPLIVSHSSDGSKISAAKVILFPASASGRFRILQACDGPNVRTALCWAVFGFDTATRTLTQTSAGKYGPERWIAWSEDEAFAVLANENEGANWLHILSAGDFKSTPFPDDVGEMTIIDFSSFEWLTPRLARVRLVWCGPPDYCEQVRIEVDGDWEILSISSTAGSVEVSVSTDSDTTQSSGAEPPEQPPLSGPP